MSRSKDGIRYSLIRSLPQSAQELAEAPIRAQEKARCREALNNLAEKVAKLIGDNPPIRAFLAKKTQEFAEKRQVASNNKTLKKEDDPAAWYWGFGRDEPSFESKCAMVSMLHDRLIGLNLICREAHQGCPELERKFCYRPRGSTSSSDKFYRLFYDEIYRSEDLKSYLQGYGAESSREELRGLLETDPNDAQSKNNNPVPPSDPNGIVLKEEERTVLEEIDAFNCTILGTNVIKRLERAVPGQKRVRNALGVLQDLGFINRPRGPQSGYSITAEGKKYLSD